MIDFVPTSGQLGQATPATEGTVKQGFSNAEKIMLASVVLGAIGLTINVLHIFGYIKPNTGQSYDLLPPR